jgi:hypothetical protein
LPGTASLSTTNLTQGRFGNIGIRRAPSISSGPPVTAPSSTALHSLLVHYAAASSQEMAKPNDSLPYETDVLSVLLMPFLTAETDQATENARLQSLESFEMIIKTWSSFSNEARPFNCSRDCFVQCFDKCFFY